MTLEQLAKQPELYPAWRSNSSSVLSSSSGEANLRLLFVTPRYFPYMGGIENHVYQVARRLALAGVDVHVLTTDPSRRLPQQEQNEGVHIRRVPAWPANGDLYLAPAIMRIIQEGNWDLVHLQSYHTFVAPLAMLAALRAGIPYVVTFHGGGHSSRLRNSIRGIQQAGLRPLFARANKLIATAQFEMYSFPRKFGIPKERFVFIPNGADLPVVQGEPEPKKDGVWIASVGRLERYKGHQRILAAMPHILARNPDVRLWIAGSGPYEDKLRKHAANLGVTEQVEIRGIPAEQRAIMAKELSQVDLVVLLSEYETHPMAVLEALALGRPALVANTSGLKELAEQGYAKGIPLESTPLEVAAAVIDQLERPLLPPQMNLSSWNDCTRDLLNLYRSICSEEPRCAS